MVGPEPVPRFLPSSNLTFHAAVLWGALGKEIYGPKGPYFIVPLGLVIGLALPVIPWLLYKRFRWSWLPLINTAVLAYNIGDLAGGTNGYINTWMAIGLTSHFYIRRYRAGWFRKYNVRRCRRHGVLVCPMSVC